MTTAFLISVCMLLFLMLLTMYVVPKRYLRRHFSEREDLSDADLLQLFCSSRHLSPETLKVILVTVGSVYGVPFRKLRPNDCIIKTLGKFDSWRFDEGAEKLERTLRAKFGIRIDSGLTSFTIEDLIRLVEASKHASRHDQAK